MFTGIVEEMGEVVSSAREADLLRVVIRAPKTPGELSVGGSVSVSGCCLTATAVSPDTIHFDLAPETVERTRFDRRLGKGALVNLELPLRLSGRLDGHFVQGHVDGVATTERVEVLGASAEIEFEIPRDLARYCVLKGSIAIDGVSLTCASVNGSRVTVAVIPHTLKVTTLGRLKPGDPVNVEVDLVAKYVEKLLPK